ncbi:MAG: hypothetical protein ACI3T9_04320 [Romboutsia timonensis]
MIKGTRCDNCEEEIKYEGYHLHLQGLDYWFCDRDCAEDWVVWLMEHEYVEDPEDYDV